MGLAVLAVAALSVISIASPLQTADASTVRGADQSNHAAAQDGVINAQVGVNANVQTGDICVQALAADSENC
jgi:hypothetical protein